jgi:hypothetical protein
MKAMSRAVNLRGNIAQSVLLITLVGHQLLLFAILYVDNRDKLSLLHSFHLAAIIILLFLNLIVASNFIHGKIPRIFNVFVFFLVGCFGLYQIVQIFEVELAIQYVPGLLLVSFYSLLLTTFMLKFKKRISIKFLKKKHRPLMINYIASCIILILLQIAAFFQFESLVIFVGLLAYLFILLDQIVRALKLYMMYIK